MIKAKTSEEKIDEDFYSAIKLEQDAGVVKALFKDSNRKLRV